MWLKMRWGAEVDCKAFDFMLGNLVWSCSQRVGRTLQGNMHLTHTPWINSRDREEGHWATVWIVLCLQIQGSFLPVEQGGPMQLLLEWKCSKMSTVPFRTGTVGWELGGSRYAQVWADGNKDDDRCLHSMSPAGGKLAPSPRAVGLCPSSAQPVSCATFSPQMLVLDESKPERLYALPLIHVWARMALSKYHTASQRVSIR